jgi:hypothetical protein
MVGLDFRRLSHPLLPDAGVRRAAALLHGTGSGAVPSQWLSHHLAPYLSSTQRSVATSIHYTQMFAVCRELRCFFMRISPLRVYGPRCIVLARTHGLIASRHAVQLLFNIRVHTLISPAVSFAAPPAALTHSLCGGYICQRRRFKVCHAK